MKKKMEGVFVWENTLAYHYSYGLIQVIILSSPSGSPWGLQC